MNVRNAILKIILSGILSVIISMAGVNYGAVELGAIIYFIIPVTACIITLISYKIIVNAFTINRPSILANSFIALNIVVGIFMRLDFYYNIVNW